MNREMRRKRQLLAEAEAVAMLQAATSGVLAVNGDDGYPYAVPMSFAYEDGKLFFHSATAGHKIDAIARDERVSFCVIDTDDVVQETFTTHYRSAIAFGRIRTLTDDAEIRHALRCLSDKYSPAFPAEAEGAIEQDRTRLVALEMAIEKLTGKAARELVAESR